MITFTGKASAALKKSLRLANYIYETAVYCGSQKEWRILNLNSGTIYSMAYESEELALNAIEDGEKRAGHIVKRISLQEIRVKLIT